MRSGGLQTRWGYSNLQSPALDVKHAGASDMLGGPWLGCSVKDFTGASLGNLSVSVSEYKAFSVVSRKDVYKPLIMISNELSKSSLGSIDITTPCRNGPGMRKR